MERQKIKKPNQPRYPTDISEVYTYRDLFVGAVLNINNFQFHLYDADEYCYRFMENNPSLFPYSNTQSIKAKILNGLAAKNAHADEASQIFKPYDGQNTGNITFEAFYNLVKNTFRKICFLS